MSKLGKDTSNYRHGHSAKSGVSPTYQSWRGMKERCTSKKHKNYDLYKNRLEDELWLEFKNFLADMGDRPEGCTLDRIDNDRGYCKDNCHWSTSAEQHRNHSRNVVIEYEGKSQCMKDWCKELDRNYSAVAQRIRRYKWDKLRALTTPTKQGYKG